MRGSLKDSQKHRGGAVIEMGVSFIRSHRGSHSVVQTECCRGCLRGSICVCEWLCQPAQQKDRGASFFFGGRADERKRRERKVHSFILSFPILPLGAQKITSRLI